MGGGCWGKHVVPGPCMCLHCMPLCLCSCALCVYCMVWTVCCSLSAVYVVSVSTLPHLSVLLLALSASALLLPDIWKSSNDSLFRLHHFSPLFYIFILGCFAIIISFSNGTLMLYSQSKESGHMSSLQHIRKHRPWPHSLIPSALFMFAAYAWILLPLMIRLCCRIWRQSVTSNLMILKLCKMFSVPLKEKQQGYISNYYIITILLTGYTVIIRTECIWFSVLPTIIFQNYSISHVYVATSSVNMLYWGK